MPSQNLLRPREAPPDLTRVSVIIPTYNRSAGICRCVTALFAQELNGVTVDVHVVDDGSTDDTAEVLSDLMDRSDPSDRSELREPSVRLHLHHQSNAGPSAARNRGAEAADADLLLFTDDDCEPEPGWVMGLVNAGWDGRLGGAAGCIVSPDGSNWVSRYCRYIHYNEFPKKKDMRLGLLTFVNTANCAYLRRAFLELGGFDPLFSHIGYEDVDFARRMTLLGYRLEYVKEAVVHHYHRETVEAFRDAFRKRGRADILLAEVWGEGDPLERALRDEIRELRRLKLRRLLMYVNALALRNEGVAKEDALGYARLEWLKSFARQEGAIEMLRGLIAGTQSTTRGARLPDYGIPPKRALRKVRRQLREERDRELKPIAESEPCLA
jgi:GT2 family glycosyltransferase